MKKSARNLFSTMPNVLGKVTVATLCMFSVVCLCVLTACEKPVPSGDDSTMQGDTIVISESALKTVICWQNLNADTAYLINSIGQFQQLVCQDTVPEIDFGTHSLIVAHGGTTYGIDTLTKNLQQKSAINYELEVDILLGMTAVAQGWSVVMLTPKLPQGIILTFKKNEHFY